MPETKHEVPPRSAPGKVSRNDDGSPEAPNTASPPTAPSGVVSADGLPERPARKVELEAAARDKSGGTEPPKTMTPTGRPAHLHPGPRREGAAPQNGMMQQPQQTPSGYGRLALIVVAVIAIAVVIWLV